jgi:serine O-acetyltransferase
MHALKADTYRSYGKFGWGVVLKGLLLRDTFRVLLTLRCCQAAQRFPRPLRWLLLPPARLMHGLTSQLANVEIPWRTEIGAGMALTHARGAMISGGARIGRNVTIFHGVTLGQRDRIDADGGRVTGYPVIEDEVWIGPHAIIVGDVTIGKGSRIAGGAFVFKTVPPYCVVLGNPGEIVKRDCVPDVDNRVDFNT